MVRRWVPVVVAVVAVAAAGCGSDEADPSPGAVATESETASSSPSSTGSIPPGTPPCADVWEDQATLPRSYDGCVDDSGQLVASDPLACSSGQKIIRYDDRFYAVPGGTIHAADAPLNEDSEYRAAALRCRA